MGPPVTVWPEARVAAPLRLIDDGWNNARLAAHFGVTVAAVRSKRCKLRIRTRPVGRTATSKRGTKQGTSWRRAEEIVARDMALAGDGVEQIAQALPPRSPRGVAQKLRLMGVLPDPARRVAEASAPTIPPAVAQREVEPFAERVRTERILRDPPPAQPQQVRRRVEPLFDTEVRLVPDARRPKLGHTSFAGSVLAGVPIHPAHRRG